jgi:hypothetical protein
MFVTERANKKKREYVVTIFYLAYYRHSSDLTPWKVVTVYIGFLLIGYVVCSLSSVEFPSDDELVLNNVPGGIVYKKH